MRGDGKPRFSAKTLVFLTKASRQKNPLWLERNRSEYEAALLAPLKQMAEEAKKALSPLAPGYHFPLKGIGRMRRPPHWEQRGGGIYKNWMSYSAKRPSGSRFENNPNLYFMIDLNDDEDPILVAGGLYVPSSRQVRAIREAIARDTTPFSQLFASKAFARCFPRGFSKDRTATRPPRGFDPNHPRMDWLKLQGFFVWKPYSKREFFAPNFSATLIRDWTQILRLNALLDRAIQHLPMPTRNKTTQPQTLSDRLDIVSAPLRPMDF